MANTLLNSVKTATNVGRTQNGAVAYKSTLSAIADLFGTGAAYRAHTDSDCIVLFQRAYEEDPTLALKCLFYLRDIRGGQGERRFFRIVIHWLANHETEAMKRNLIHISEYGRWDDYYAFVGTALEKDAFDIMYHQLALDVSCKTPSLLAKWLKSENASSKQSRKLALHTAAAFKMSPRQYRKTLSVLRARINIVERLMSENRWDEIEFDKIPSKAGLIYRNAFARRDILKEKYTAFAKDETKKVNAGTLYPCDVVHQALNCRARTDAPERLMIDKYWDNLTDYFNGAAFNGVAVVDTSGSMSWGYGSTIHPIDVATALGMYCADKCSPASPWHGHYISFSSKPQLIKIEGVDFVDKCKRIADKNLCQNTNLDATFDLLLNSAISGNVPQSDMPESIIIISDMQIDYAYNSHGRPNMEMHRRKWANAGYNFPNVIYWNVNAIGEAKFLDQMQDGVSFVSGYSASLFEQILSGKTAMDLILDKLNSERYAVIQ